jgi:hypothetical protein
MLLRDKEVFEVNPWFAPPRGIVVKEQSKAPDFITYLS